MMAKARILLPAYALAFVWLVYSAWLTGPVISDSWQSVAAYIFAQKPFELSGAFLGDFDGYDKNWGHHWPGWSLLLSITRPYLVFHPLFVFCVGSGLVCLSSFVVYTANTTNRGSLIVGIASAIIILDPATRVSVSMMRPEALTGLLFLCVSILVIQGTNSQRGILCIFACSYLLPMLHVMGLLLAPAMVAAFCITHKFSIKNVRKDPRARLLTWLCVGWFLGAMTLAIWFLANPTRKGHFMENITAQKLSYHGIITSMKLCYFSSVVGFSLLVYWFFLAVGIINHLRAKTFTRNILIWIAIPLSVSIFSLVTHNPNPLHLVSIVPCMVMAMSKMFRHEFFDKRHLIRLVLFCGLLLPIVFHAKSAWRFVSTRVQPQRVSAIDLLQRHKDAGHLFIPCSLWEAAATLQIESARFYTFPNVAEASYRMQCERTLLSKAETGDRLILDVTQQNTMHGYFREDSLMKLTSVDPYSLGDVIEEITFSGTPSPRTYHVIAIKSVDAPFSQHQMNQTQ